ncbi:hypothetical protein INS49_012855 [Diaporthe citri]|uniref:uncharacterized protein n=1 Tax=Diaporthe citri TaxID=83186 RepID=UPI001C820F95|nr:uncharacterized protein INS49_012855 [Diaporthe citri]KAG6359334.1 hypothetical protein INS49_012855 [Diaporthe citri]
MSMPQFKDLGNDIWLYEPRDNEKNNPEHRTEWDRPSGKGHPPALIILCTWLGGATTKRIDKYTEGYHRLWPCSRILLIRTTLSEYLLQSTTSLRRRLRPAHHEIRRLGQEGQRQRQDKPTSELTSGEIILHMFSQGGSNTATQLLESMNAILSTLGHKGPLPLRQIVLDSCPGDPGIYSTFAAGAYSLPETSLLRPLGSTALFILAAGLAGMEATGLKTPLAKKMRSQLNDPEIFSARATRLYLTSEADTIVDSRDVEEHRDQAAAKGLTTDILRFHRAGHCSLVLEDGAAYWNAIASAWEKGAVPGTAQSAGEGEDKLVPQFPPVSIGASSQSRSRL